MVSGATIMLLLAAVSLSEDEPRYSAATALDIAMACENYRAIQYLRVYIEAIAPEELNVYAADEHKRGNARYPDIRLVLTELVHMTCAAYPLEYVSMAVSGRWFFDSADLAKRHFRGSSQGVLGLRHIKYCRCEKCAEIRRHKLLDLENVYSGRWLGAVSDLIRKLT